MSKELKKYTTFEKTATKRSECLNRIADFHRQINTIESTRLESGASAAVSVRSSDVLEKELESLQFILGKRRKIGKQMLSEICEQAGMSRSELIGELGLEISESPNGVPTRGS
jgi:hypothetical protein